VACAAQAGEVSGATLSRREGVSGASRALQERGIIRYRRGHISVLDRAGLELAACQCYGDTRADYERLFEKPRPVRR